MPKWPTLLDLIRVNRPWNVIEDDINKVSSSKLLKNANLNVGQADVLIGGPPCQPCSKSSYWVNGDTLRLDDPRADTLTAFLRVLRDTQPRTFLLENVPGFAYKDKDEGLRYILSHGIYSSACETKPSNSPIEWLPLSLTHIFDLE